VLFVSPLFGGFEILSTGTRRLFRRWFHRSSARQHPAE
jgi:hypothetical protein